MTDKAFFVRVFTSKRAARLLFCVLLLVELALLWLQHFVGGEIRKERADLRRVSENLARRRNDHAYMDELLKLIEAEEAGLKQKLPCGINNPALAVSLTREALNARGIAGEIRKRASGEKSIILEAECEGSYADLSAMLDSLRRGSRAARLNGLIVEALGGDRLYFAAEIEYALDVISLDTEHKEI